MKTKRREHTYFCFALKTFREDTCLVSSERQFLDSFKQQCFRGVGFCGSSIA